VGGGKTIEWELNPRNHWNLSYFYIQTYKIISISFLSDSAKSKNGDEINQAKRAEFFSFSRRINRHIANYLAIHEQIKNQVT
jgi:hypothetical protein